MDPQFMPNSGSLDSRKGAAELLLKGQIFERIGWTSYGRRIKVPEGDYVTLPSGSEMWGLTYRAENRNLGDGVREQMFIFGPGGVRIVRARRRWQAAPGADPEPTGQDPVAPSQVIDDSKSEI
jgi:hypothetical protein